MTEEDTFNRLRRISFSEAYTKWLLTHPWDINDNFWYSIGWTKDDFNVAWREVYRKPYD